MSSKLPMTPRSVQWRIKVQIIKECDLPPTLENVVSYSDSFVQMLQPNESQRKAVEKATRRQSACKRWREECYLRLTASNFGRVMLRCSNFTKLAEEILFTKLPDAIPSLKWGRERESDAFTEYLEICSSAEQETVRKAGFYIGEPSFLGASPDGIVEMVDGLKIIEIKCSYSVRDMTIEEACGKNGFYCTLENDLLHLNQEHVYYYQVQGTMAITGASKCDFVIWSSKSMMVETILFDRQDFYYEYILPCILY